MSLQFERVTGVHRDINELEYITALLQTNQKVLRTSGTVKAEDIALYLKSRHGVVVEEDVLQELIVSQMAGGQWREEDGNENRVLDICQLVAILLIPHLLQQASGGSKDCKENVFASFAAQIGGGDGGDHDPLTRDKLRAIFEECGEDNVTDDLLDEMIKLAADDEDFVAALTSDLGLYRLDWNNTDSTNFDDVALLKNNAVEKQPEDQHEAVELGEDTAKDEQQLLPLNRIHTASSVDYTADTFAVLSLLCFSGRVGLRPTLPIL